MDRFKELSQKELKQLFEKADVDKSGHMSLTELRNLIYPDGDSNDAEIIKTFTDMDKNGDGKIKISEFVSFVVFCKSGKTSQGSEEKTLRDSFSKRDSNKDTQLSLDELYSSLGCETDEERSIVSSVFDGLDVDKSGTVSLQEFAVLFGHKLAPEPEEKVTNSIEEVVEHFDAEKTASIKEIFKNADRDGDGVITRSELQDLFRKLGEWTDAEFDELFRCADKNKDGVIQYNEFLDWLLSGKVESHGVDTEDLAEAGEATKKEDSFDLAI